MAEDKPKYEKEHIDMYNKLLKAVPLDYQIKRAIKHRDAWVPALKVLEGKEVEHMDQGIELLTDALIQYRKSTGMPVSEDKEHRHHYIAEVRGLISHLAKNRQLDDDPESMFKLGNGHLILTKILEMEKERDLSGKIDYEMRKLLPPNKGFDFYNAMAHYWASLTPKKKYSKGHIAEMSTNEGILGALRNDHKIHLENELDKYFPKKADKKGKK